LRQKNQTSEPSLILSSRFLSNMDGKKIFKVVISNEYDLKRQTNVKLKAGFIINEI